VDHKHPTPPWPCLFYPPAGWPLAAFLPAGSCLTPTPRKTVGYWVFVSSLIARDSKKPYQGRLCLRSGSESQAGGPAGPLGLKGRVCGNLFLLLAPGCPRSGTLPRLLPVLLQQGLEAGVVELVETVRRLG